MSKHKITRSDKKLPKTVRRRIAKEANNVTEETNLKNALMEQANEALNETNELRNKIDMITRHMSIQYQNGSIPDDVYEEIDSNGKELTNKLSDKQDIIKGLTEKVNSLPTKVSVEKATSIGNDITDQALQILQHSEQIGRFIDLCSANFNNDDNNEGDK